MKPLFGMEIPSSTNRSLLAEKALGMGLGLPGSEEDFYLDPRRDG